MKFKICTKCGEEKSFDDFHRDKNYKNNRTCWCKECTREQHREHYKQNRDRVIAEQKIYYSNNKEKILKRNRSYQLKHPRETWTTGTLHSHAKKYKIYISREELLSFVYDTDSCEICDCKLDWIRGKGKKGRLMRNSPTLDRMDNKNFLAPHNVQIVCAACNTLKHTKTMAEFIDYCKMIAEKFA